ncbi:PAS domain S-box protein [Petrachloros mirabilis]
MTPSAGNITTFDGRTAVLPTVGVFILDLLTPLGWADWVLYFIPLALTMQSPRERDPYYFAMLITVLMGVGGYLHKDIDLLVALFNRGMGVSVMWVFAWLIVKQKRAGVVLLGVQTARSQAESRRDAAVAARELAEASALGAINRESQTARELLFSNLRLDGIIQSAMDAILTIDETGRVLLFNKAAEQMFRYSAHEAIGQSVDRFIPSRFREGHRQLVLEFGGSDVTSRKTGQLGGVLGLRGDGEEFPVEAAISRIEVEGKQYYTVILRDITERKEAERLMRQSEERYRRLIAVSPYAVVVNRGDRVLFANDQALRLFGAVKAEDILGKSPLELFHPDCHALFRERLHELIEGSSTISAVEEKVVALDGGIVEVEVSGVRFVDEEGPAILLMFHDISERKRLQEQLRKTERVAELGTLASGMAHEIGTPMNVILGRAEYLMERVNDEPVKKGLQTIISQVERITRVMNQLLAFARRRTPERGPLAMKDVIINSVEMFQQRLAKSLVQVEMNFDEQCPKVQGDPDQMSQVVINLIMNAVHAMPEGGILRITLAPEKEKVKLTVADTGIGIPQEALTKIFDPFFTTKEFGKGTGLGLTVVKGIIEEHQGSIAVESEEGKGTTFTIMLPTYSGG